MGGTYEGEGDDGFETGHVGRVGRVRSWKVREVSGEQRLETGDPKKCMGAALVVMEECDCDMEGWWLRQWLA